MSRTPLWCIFPYPKHHSGAFCKDQNIDLNKDCSHLMPRTPLWCIFHFQNTNLVHFALSKMSTSTRIAIIGCAEHNSGAFSISRTPFWCIFHIQNITLVHFASTKTSTSTRISFLGCAKHHSGALSIAKTQFWCIWQGPKRRPQQGFQSLDA